MRRLMISVFTLALAALVLSGCGTSVNEQKYSVRIKGDDNTVTMSNSGSQSSTASGNSADTKVKADAKVRP